MVWAVSVTRGVGVWPVSVTRGVGVWPVSVPRGVGVWAVSVTRALPRVQDPGLVRSAARNRGPEGAGPPGPSVFGYIVGGENVP